jgi:hypothetical protein
MQLQPIIPDRKRDSDAAKLAQNGDTWPVYTLKRDHGAFEAGTVFYGVPSRSNPKHRWLANGAACLCPDYQDRGAMCAHVRAVRLFEAQSQQQEGAATEADPTPTEAVVPLKAYRDIFPGCAAGCGDLVERQGERCYACLQVETRRLDQERKRAAVVAR